MGCSSIKFMFCSSISFYCFICILFFFDLYSCILYLFVYDEQVNKVQSNTTISQLPVELEAVATYTSEAMCTVYQTRSSLNICRQMALFEMVQTLILRFANMEKWINSLNLSKLIIRTLQ